MTREKQLQEIWAAQGLPAKVQKDYALRTHHTCSRALRADSTGLYVWSSNYQWWNRMHCDSIYLWPEPRWVCMKAGLVYHRITIGGTPDCGAYFSGFLDGWLVWDAAWQDGSRPNPTKTPAGSWCHSLPEGAKACKACLRTDPVGKWPRFRRKPVPAIELVE